MMGGRWFQDSIGDDGWGAVNIEGGTGQVGSENRASRWGWGGFCVSAKSDNVEGVQEKSRAGFIRLVEVSGQGDNKSRAGLYGLPDRGSNKRTRLANLCDLAEKPAPTRIDTGLVGCCVNLYGGEGVAQGWRMGNRGLASIFGGMVVL